MRKLLLVPIILALASAGCIQNMADLKDNLKGSDETLQPAAVSTSPTAQPAKNVTTNATALKAPVARMSIFAPGGALLYKSSFTAEDPADILFVDAKSKLSLLASDSEALERDAKIAGFAWSLNGKPLESARQASAELADAGLYVLSLTVTDSNGKSDAQTVKLGVAPQPYDVTLELATGPILGVNGQGLAETLPFTLAADASKGPASVQKVVIVASPDLLLDAAIAVVDKDGNAVGDVDTHGHTDLDQTETLELAALPLGDYSITVSGALGVDPDGVPITITITFLPIVPGLDGHDGGGHHH